MWNEEDKKRGYKIGRVEDLRVPLKPIDIKAFLDDPLGYSESLKWINAELLEHVQNPLMSREDIDGWMQAWEDNLEIKDWTEADEELKEKCIRNFREVMNTEWLNEKWLGQINERSFGEKSNEKESVVEEEDERFISLNSLLSSGIEKPEWLIESITKKSGITMFIGEYKSAKSFLAMYLTLCVANGVDFLGFKNKQGPRIVLFIDEENGEIDLAERFRRIAEGMNLKTDKIYLLIFKDFKLQGKNSVGWKFAIRDFIEKHHPALIVCDSLVRLIEGDEDKSKDAREVFEFIKPFKTKTNWLLLHHTPKGVENARGSGDWVAQVDDAFIIKSSGKRNEHKFTLKTYRSRGAKFLEGIDFQLIGDEEEPIIFNCLGNRTQFNKRQEYEKSAFDIASWLIKTEITNFKSADVKKQFPDMPDTRKVQALKYLYDNSCLSRIGNTTEGKYFAILEGLTKFVNSYLQIGEMEINLPNEINGNYG
ncbi:MAG: AAA family ATPase [Nanoarchaeota archaeon]